MRNGLLMVGCLCCLMLPAWGQQRPLETDDAELLGVGWVRTEVGVEFLQGQRYSLSGLEGDLTRLGVAGVQVGAGEYAEFQISAVVRDFLLVSQRTTPVAPPDFLGNSTSDYGNMVLGTKLKLASEKGVRPAIAFKFAVELPNTKRASGLGADETEFYSNLLFSKRLSRIRALGSLGLAILANPLETGRQVDMLTYGLGVLVPINGKVKLVGEITGRQGPSHERIGNENRSRVRVGIQLQTGKFRWDVGGIAGLRRYDPDSGLAMGLTYTFKAFHK